MWLRSLISLSLVSFFSVAQPWDTQTSALLALYDAQLNGASLCPQSSESEVHFCSSALRNDTTGPFLLLHNNKTSKVIVLFHGLSDSPFYFRSIANALYENGNNVVVALLPGHGLNDAKAAMRDPNLALRWQSHVAKVIEVSANLGDTLYLGGFSTGAALALNYGLRHPEQRVSGYLMFSGAFALNDNVEKLSTVPGIKWITRWLDRNYQSIGDNPYKYPDVSKHAATMLMDIIRENRSLIDESGLNASIFFAHSKSDVTTPIQGVEALVKQNAGHTDTYFIAEQYNVCHGNLVLNSKQINDIGIKENSSLTPCAVPIANPVHAQMLERTIKFLN